MTVRLLKPYAQRPVGAIATFDASTEAGMIEAKLASADLTGGFEYFLPRPGLKLQVPQIAVGSIMLRDAEQAPVLLPEGQVLNVIGAPGTAGKIQRLNPAGGFSSVQSWTIGADALPVIGPYAGQQRFLVMCTVGRLDVTPAAAALTSVRAVGDTPGSVSSPSGNAIPAWYRSRAASLLALGDSLSAQGMRQPILPAHGATRPLNQVFTNINAGGLFIVLSETSNDCPVGAGTVRYYANSKSLSWQAFGDAEGPPVAIPTSGFYTLQSGTAGHAMYVGVVARLRPAVDKTDAINNTGVLRMNSNAGIFGPTPWAQLLLGNPYSTILGYAIPSIRASDWLDAREQWQGIYTDVTRIALGTNDVTDRASALQALADVEQILRLRLGIGSRPFLVALTPYDTRPAGATAAVLEFNQGLRAMAARYNVDVSDPWPYLVNANGTGAFAPGMATDGLHFSNLGSYLVAARVETAIHRKYVGVADVPSFCGSPYNAATAPYGNHLINPQMIGLGGSKGAGVTGEVPNGWACTRDGASANITAACRAPDSANAISRADKRQGKYATVEISNTGGVDGEAIRFRPAAFITAGYAPGDLFVLEGDIRIQGIGIQYVFVETVLDNSPGPVTYSAAAVGTNTVANAAMGDLGGDVVSIPYRGAPVRVDAGITRMIIGIVVGMRAGGAAVLDIGQTQNLHKVAS